MTGVEASEIRLGVAVFGRLSGFPWWPAVVSKCEPSGDWTKDGKFWVIFFNDRNGAWLKSSEIRSFDAYNKDRCLEHNNSTPKFRRYHERVNKACTMAEKYISSPKRIRVRVVGPRGTNGAPIGDEEEVISISDGGVDVDRSGASSEPTEPSRKKRNRSTKSGAKRDRSRPRSKDQSDEDEEISEDDNVRSGEKGRDGDGRSKRKRVRSSRYEEFIGPLEDRNTQKRKKPRADANARPSSDDNELNPLHYSPPKGFRIEAGKLTRSKKPKSSVDGNKDVRQRQNPRPSRRTSRTSSQTAAEEVVEKQRTSKRTDRRASSKKVISKRLAHEPMRPPSHTDEDKRDDAAVTREMYISELTNMVSPKAHHRHGRRAERIADVTSLKRSVRSRAGGSSLENTSNSEETDSEEEPERVRKVVNGSLEAAAEDLVEYAVRGEQDAPGKQRDDILNRDSLALGGSELVCSILNRISDLERDVTLLQKNSTLEEQATLGEDATAAGLKSAVEALASATTAFAKARDYDSPMISRSLDLLWSDGHFPLKGADGELLRTVARSLVLASCKRKYAQSQDRVIKSQQRPKVRISRAVRKSMPLIIRQKADVRELNAKEESVLLFDDEQSGSDLSVGCATQKERQSTSSQGKGTARTQLKDSRQLRSPSQLLKATVKKNEGLGGVSEDVEEENAELPDPDEIMDGGT